MTHTDSTEAGTLAVTFPVGGGTSPLSGVVRCNYRHTKPMSGGWGVLTSGVVNVDDVILGNTTAGLLNPVIDTTATYTDVSFDVDTRLFQDGSHTLVILVSQTDSPNLLLYSVRITFTSSNPSARRGVRAANLFVEPGESVDFLCAVQTGAGDESVVPGVSAEPTITLAYYGDFPSSTDPGPTTEVAGGVLTYTAGTGEKANDVTQYDVVTDAGDTLTHLVFTRAAGDRPHFGRNGNIRTTYDPEDSIIPLAVFGMGPDGPPSYGGVALGQLQIANIIPQVTFLPEIPEDCADDDEWWTSSSAWRASMTSSLTTWGGKVYGIDDATWGVGYTVESWEKRFVQAVHQSWWNDGVERFVNWWATQPSGLPLFVVARDEVDLAFGSDPTDEGNANIAIVGGDAAGLYVDSIRLAGGPPVGWYAFGLSCLYGSRGFSGWQTPTFSDFTNFSGDTSDTIRFYRQSLVGADREYASIARHIQTDRVNVGLCTCQQWSDWVWIRNATLEAWKRARFSVIQIPAFCTLPLINGSLALRPYTAENFAKRTVEHQARIDAAPAYPDTGDLIQYGCRFERAGDYYVDAKQSGDAVLIFATMVRQLTALLTGTQVTAIPWGPGWRLGRWESARGKLILAVNVSGGTERIPPGIDLTGFSSVSWVDGVNGRVNKNLITTPGSSVPADTVVVLTS